MEKIELKPCPFCGGTEIEMEDNAYMVSHHAEHLPGGKTVLLRQSMLGTAVQPKTKANILMTSCKNFRFRLASARL